VCTYIWDRVEKFETIASATVWAEGNSQRLQHQSASKYEKGRAGGRARRYLAGAEEAGDDGGGNAGIQRLRIEGRVGEAPQELDPRRRRRPQERRRSRSEASGEGIEGPAGYSGPGRPRKQLPRSRGRHVDRLDFLTRAPRRLRPAGRVTGVGGFWWRDGV
jgi:hypothetical protein